MSSSSRFSPTSRRPEPPREDDEAAAASGGADRARRRRRARPRRRRVLRPDPAEEGRGRAPPEGDRRGKDADLRLLREERGGEGPAEDPERRPLPPREGDAGSGGHVRRPAPAQPDRRRHGHHLPVHRPAELRTDLRLPGGADPPDLPGELLQPRRLPVPAAEPRRRRARAAERDRPPVRDRHAELRRGAGRLPADLGHPRRGRLRVRDADARDGDPDDHDVDHLDDLDLNHDHDGEPLMAKRLDPKAKAKREKVIAGVGGLVLLGVLAFAIPMTMKQLKSQQAPTAAAAAPTTSTATPTVTASLASSGVTSTVPLGQLGSLSRFDSKDPFAQQV